MTDNDKLNAAAAAVSESTEEYSGKSAGEYSGKAAGEYSGEDLSADDEGEEDDVQTDSCGGDRFSFVIGSDRAGERIDKVISDCMPGQSRSYIKKLIKDGNVVLTGSGSDKSVKPSTTVAGGEQVSVFLPVQMLPDILPEDSLSISPRTWSSIPLQATTAALW